MHNQPKQITGNHKFAQHFNCRMQTYHFEVYHNQKIFWEILIELGDLIGDFKILFIVQRPQTKYSL